MFVVEISAGFYGNSLALQADALDFFGDAANYGISLFVLTAAIQTKALASIIKAITMSIFGIWVITMAIVNYIHGSQPEPATMGLIAFLALGVNVLVAFLLFHYRDNDSNMQSVWLCSRNDAIGNIAVLIAAIGVFSTHSNIPDLAVATIIAGLALSSAWQIVKTARQEIASQAVKC
jgi:Co/Zn/Cd efflux system component